MASNITTPGHEILNSILPEDIKPEGNLDKKGIKQLFEELARKHPDKYVNVLDSLNRAALPAATEYGDTTSFSLDDLEPSPRLKEYRKRLRDRIDNIIQDPSIGPKTKNQRVVDLVRGVTDKVRSKVMDEERKAGNKFVKTSDMGIKGNPLQIAQILFGDLIMADHKGRPVPIPGLTGYGEGVSPAEFWAGAYGSRSGFATVQMGTQDSGFLTKKMAMLPHRVSVTGEDCGAQDVGITRDTDDVELLGTALAMPVGPFKKNHVVTKKDLPKLREYDSVLVRSLLTCQQPEGVCQKCSGIRETGKFPEIGDMLGPERSRLVGEPLTQAKLNAKHTGGLDAKEGLTGFDAFERLFNVPKNFKGGAVLTPKTGEVTKVMAAPQGGTYIMVGSEQVHIPKDREVIVKKGDKLEQGDVLSSGLVNPREIAKYKGIGAGRTYFLNQLHDIARKEGIDTHARNIEPMAREFFNRVKITNPEGWNGYAYGDIVPYSEIQREYTPREGSMFKDPRYVKGKYLEKPVLEYSIGTKITPSIVHKLNKYNVKEVMVNDKQPGFDPHITRIEDVLTTDPDFKARMASWYVKKSFLDAARHGAESKKDGASYVKGLMNPREL